MRRVAAVVVVLAASLLMHFAKPQHTASSSLTTPASVTAPVAEAEPRKPQGPSSAASSAGTQKRHQDEAFRVVARPPRAVGPEVRPPAADNLAAGETNTTHTGSGTAQPHTARDSWNPAAGITPTCRSLQTFRC
nr:hypothetical protein [Streptomyces hygroscopicus]